MRLLNLALTGLATLAVAATNAPSPNKDTTTAGHVPPFINQVDGGITYHCSTTKPALIDQHTKGSDSGDISPIYTCLGGDCYEFGTGATCSESTVDVKARAPIPQEDRHKICSKDRASVLICLYGFCSTDHYCNRNGVGDYCHDDCNCCKVGPFMVADNAPRPLVAARADAAGAFDASKVCPKPGMYMCNTPYKKVYVCSALSEWKLSADCRPGKCVENLSAGTAFCKANLELDNSARDTDQKVAREAASEDAPMDIIPLNRCSVPGSYMCDETFQAIGVCNSVYEWKLSADCRPGHCAENLSAGTAYCVARRSARDLDTPERKSSESSTVEFGPLEYCSNPGEYTCSTDHTVLGVCNAQDEWQLSADCSPGHCNRGPGGTAFCVAKTPMAVLDARVPATTAQYCLKPGAYRCDSTGQLIAVCSSGNEWVLSSDCSPGHCVDGPNDTAYCTG